jgi:NTP pyrophosphatase (non-canonical NTP hydrolase)
MNKILTLLLEFRKKRDWIQFHSLENIAKSIVLESAELLEIFQWKKDTNLTTREREMAAEELADVYNWVLLMAHDLDIDIEEEAIKKIEKNNLKYPVEKSKGKSVKYTKL